VPSSTVLTIGATRTWRDYVALCKPKVVALIVFTAIIGMLLATPGMVPLDVLVLGSRGIGGASAAGAAINHLADRRIDALMARTSHRPLPSGKVDTASAAIFATVLCTVSVAILAWGVNGLTAGLTFASMVGYAVIYSLFLKRATPQNIVIGGAAGAMPPVLGWSAVTGEVDPHALLLFLIIFAWTPPHFRSPATSACITPAASQHTTAVAVSIAGSSSVIPLSTSPSTAPPPTLTPESVTSAARFPSIVL